MLSDRRHIHRREADCAVLAMRDSGFRSLVASWCCQAMSCADARYGALLNRYRVVVPHTLAWLARIKDNLDAQ